MAGNKPILLQAFFIGLVFFLYYSFTGYHLPASAGPDYPVSQDAVNFYLEHGRLAVIPEDEGKLSFSKYGNSRVVRPPLAFVGAALLAKISPYLKNDWRFAYRHASALFLALALSIMFLTLMLYFAQKSLAVLGVLLVGLMPQYAFTASYLNDDSSAFFACSLVVFAMLWISKSGINFLRLALFGFAVGLALIAKKTAWLMMPFVALFYLLFVIAKHRSFIKDNAILFVFFMLGGGWWLVFNIYHYGWLDPFAFNMLSDLTSRHMQIDPSQYGFKAEGINMKGLILLNYKNFIGASFMAVVGHLDWLRLRVGDVQYGAYLFVVLLAVYYCLDKVIRFGISLFKTRQDKKRQYQNKLKELIQNKNFQFEVILISIIIFQIVMYVYHNVYNDIQIQGKYIIPVILPLVIFSIAGLKALMGNIFISTSEKSSHIVIWILISVTILVHIDALISHVIPFYWP